MIICGADVVVGERVREARKPRARYGKGKIERENKRKRGKYVPL